MDSPDVELLREDNADRWAEAIAQMDASPAVCLGISLKDDDNHIRILSPSDFEPEFIIALLRAAADQLERALAGPVQ